MTLAFIEKCCCIIIICQSDGKLTAFKIFTPALSFSHTNVTFFFKIVIVSWNCCGLASSIFSLSLNYTHPKISYTLQEMCTPLSSIKNELSANSECYLMSFRCTRKIKRKARKEKNQLKKMMRKSKEKSLTRCDNIINKSAEMSSCLFWHKFLCN